MHVVVDARGAKEGLSCHKTWGPVLDSTHLAALDFVHEPLIAIRSAERCFANSTPYTLRTRRGRSEKQPRHLCPRIARTVSCIVCVLMERGLPTTLYRPGANYYPKHTPLHTPTSHCWLKSRETDTENEEWGCGIIVLGSRHFSVDTPWPGLGKSRSKTFRLIRTVFEGTTPEPWLRTLGLRKLCSVPTA